jgi:hypothetical protein
MSTTIGIIRDAVDPRIELEVYVGTGGVALFRDFGDHSCTFWLSPAGRMQLIEMLRAAPAYGAEEDTWLGPGNLALMPLGGILKP